MENSPQPPSTISTRRQEQIKKTESFLFWSIGAFIPIETNLINLQENEVSFAELRKFFLPLAERPALAAFFCSVLYVCSARYPLYGAAFLPLLLVTLEALPRFPRRISLFLLFGLGLRLFVLDCMQGDDKRTGELSIHGSGFVESVLDRPEGIALIVNGPEGKVRLSRKMPPYPVSGDSIAYAAKWFSVEPPSVPGSFDSPKWLKSQGLVGFGRLESFEVLSHRWTFDKAFSSVRKFLKGYFSRYLSPAESGLLIGLLAGDRSSIPDTLQNGFRRAGIVHVLAISGFHIVLLSGILLLLLKATRMPHSVASALSILLMLAYAPVTGGSPAVYRAVFMFSVVQIGLLFERKADSLNSLGVALFLLTAFDPDILWNVGFQLSAAATAGIIAFGKRSPFTAKSERLRKSRLWKFLEKEIFGAIWITVVATISTAPFLVWSFHSLSPISILGNICVVPLVSLGMQAGIFALILPVPFIAETFCKAAGFLFRISAFLVERISAVTLASITVGPFPVWILVLVGLGILTVSAFRKNVWARRFSLGIFLVLGGYLVWTECERKWDARWEVSVLDIGQGDCIFIRSPRGESFLVDAGVNTGKRNVARDKIIPFLQESGVWKLKGMIITHPDLDHFSGAEVLLREFPIETLWIQECARVTEKKEWQSVLSTAMEKKVAIQDLRRGMLFRETTRQSPHRTSSWEMRVLHPAPFRCGETNSESVTLRLEGIGGSMLLTGDLTKEGERKILATDIPLGTDILKLGHHGSKTSSSREFLEAVNPRIAIASNGRRNKFRHPHRQVTERLDSLKIPLLNTSQKGTVKVTFDKNGYHIHKTID